MVRAVIFDLDGTIADSVDLFYGFSCDVAADLGLPAPDRETVLALMRTGRSTLTHLFPREVPRQRIVEAFNVRGPDWVRRYYEHTEPLPGSIEALQRLHGAGLTLGIATSSGRDVPFLERWGVRHLFGAVVGREDVEHRKPAPDVILQCMERIGASAPHAVYVGDSPIDIQAGKAAALGTVGVLTGASGREVLVSEQPDAILSSLAELPDYILAGI